MKVVLEDETLVGEVIEILEYAAYHTLRVKREDGSNILIPYIEEFIVSTDLASKTIVFRPIEGML
jgi:16S rRNA processing protein RimM